MGVSTVRMLSLFLLSLTACVQAGGNTQERILRNLNKWNSDVACWGAKNAWDFHVALYAATEQCAQYGNIGTLIKPVNPFSSRTGNSGNPWLSHSKIRKQFSSGNQWANLWSDYISRGRSKREEQGEQGNMEEKGMKRIKGLLEFDFEEETQNFIEDYADFKEDLGSKLGNLTCVLTKLDILDSALQVNLQLYTSDMWEKMDLSKTLAGEDPLWRRKMTDGFNDCYEIAQKWPQETLERNPLSKVFGRHMIFFKCVKKVEKKMCTAAQVSDWMDTFYGQSEDVNWVQLGLPQDKYDRAILTIKVLTEEATSEEKFIDDFFNEEAEL